MREDRYGELTKTWFRKSQDDLLWAKHSFKGGYFGATCFICQQGAEKALKAYLFSQREKLTRTHSLLQLLKYSQKYESGFEELKSACKVLTRYYTDTRYPDIWDYSRFEDEELASEALHLAEEVLKLVEKKIKR